MGKGPGTSRSCVLCRQRRKKCDLNHPCARCLRSGSACSGPVRDSIFVHRNFDNLLRESDQAVLTAALGAQRTNQRQQADRTTRMTTSMVRSVRQTPSVSSSIDDMISTIANQNVYATLVEDFRSLSITIVPRDACLPAGIPIYSTILGCIRALVSLTSLRSRLLDLGIFSLLSLYTGKLRANDNDQINLARSMYTHALEELRRRIANQDHMVDSQQQDSRVCQLIFCLCLSLSLFDMIDQSETHGRSPDPHIDGASTILLLNGPVAYTSLHMQAAFSCFRGIVIGRAIRRRQPTFLAKPEWQQIPFQHHVKNDIEKLHDIMSQLPEILHRTDDIALRRVDGTILPSAAVECSRLIQEYHDLRLKLEKWYIQMVATCTISQNDPWLDKDPSQQEELDGGFREILLFANSIPESKAGVLIHYWTLSLSLVIGVFDLFIATRDISHLEVKRTLDVDSYRETGCIMAKNILFATNKLSQDPERRLVLRMPLETVSLFMAKLQLVSHV